jgi:hypothetical protein
MVDGVPPPVVQLAVTDAVVVRGSGFGTGEVVRVQLAVGRVLKLARARADEHGAFKVRFSALIAIDPCRGRIVVTARGASGDRARLERECHGPPPTPA